MVKRQDAETMERITVYSSSRQQTVAFVIGSTLGLVAAWLGDTSLAGVTPFTAFIAMGLTEVVARNGKVR